MPQPYEPISLGSPRFRTVSTDAFWVTEAWFPPGLVLPPHLHERATVAVMLEGSFDVTFRGLALECTPCTLHTEPLGERHGNRMGSRGSHVVVLQPDPAQEELVRPCAPLLERAQSLPDAAAGALAWRIAAEIRSPDALSPLAIEGLALELVSAAARLRAPVVGRRVPPWLASAEELLRERFTAPLRLADVAREVGVHPAYLARAFRARHRLPMAAFVRRLRLEWAMRQLATSDAPLARIALDAGFADQSHFTRAFKRHTGSTPGRYRRALRG